MVEEKLNWIQKIAKGFKDFEKGLEKMEARSEAADENELADLKKKNATKNKKAKLKAALAAERKKYYRNNGGGLFQ